MTWCSKAQGNYTSDVSQDLTQPITEMDLWSLESLDMTTETHPPWQWE